MYLGGVAIIVRATAFYRTLITCACLVPSQLGSIPICQLHARIYYKFHFPSSSFDHSLLHLKMATYGWIKSRGLQFAPPAFSLLNFLLQ